MAERRMFSKNVLHTDNFIQLPLSAQAVYFHLSLVADDDGFVSNPISTIRTIGAKLEDIQILTDHGYLIYFQPGLYLIKHWLQNNTIKKDRYKRTIYLNETKKVQIAPDNTYTIIDDSSNSLVQNQENEVKSISQHSKSNSKMDSDSIQHGTNMDPGCNHSIDKSSIDKSSVDKNILENKKDKKNVNIHNTNFVFEKEMSINKKQELFKIFWTFYPLKENENCCKEFFIHHIHHNIDATQLIDSLKKHLKSDQWYEKSILSSINWLQTNSWKSDNHLTNSIYINNAKHKANIDIVIRKINSSLRALQDIE